MDAKENKNNHQAETETKEAASTDLNVPGSLFNQKEDADSGSDKLKFIAFFVVAFLVGVVIKTQASNFLEVGYNDHKIDGWKSDFNLEIEEVQQNENNNQESAENQDAIDAGGSCGG